MIHGDIKPDNIFLTKLFDVRLADFSLSQVCTEDYIEINDICGTPRYVAPEYINTEYDEESQKEIATVNQKVDYWALGAVWYEMVTGKQAFPQEDRADIFSAITNGKIELQPTTNENFLKIINGLL